MRQALHIFLKDSRQLRYPIESLLAWTLAFVALGYEPWLRTGTLDSDVNFVRTVGTLLFPLGS